MSDTVSGHPTLELVFVGGGPRTTSLLERLAASAPELLAQVRRPVRITVVDPHPAGGGRVWRDRQSPLLWMNSVAKDVTMFTDASVTCEGPIVPGPALDEWVAGEGRDLITGESPADQLGPDDFASRSVQAAYLDFVFQSAVRSLAASAVPVEVIEQTAIAVDDTPAARQLVTLADGRQLTADVVVLAQGYLDRELDDDEAALDIAARAADLTYLPPGYTADIDLSPLRAGERVLVRGFGLAFIDLMVLTCEGRGGRFVPDPGRTDGLRYLPSGDEPVLIVGSRRGVPYHAKLGYDLPGLGPVPPRYLTPARLGELAGMAPTGTVDWATQIWPLVAKELAHAHYARLFGAHPQRTVGDWADLAAAIDRLDVLQPEFARIAERAVPDPRDRFDLPRIDRPLAGRHFEDRAALSRAVEQYVRDDLDRRADPEHSADRAVFNALLSVYFALSVAITAGHISGPDRVLNVEGHFLGLFSFLASGPPPARLRQLLALVDAGVVEFAGPDLRVEVDGDCFVGRSSVVDEPVVATALVDARLPRPDVRAATDPIIRGLLQRGELAAEDLFDATGRSLGGGQVLADARCRAVRADGSVHPARFLLGPSVSGSAGSGGFARPHFNGPNLRQNDQVARDILRLVAERDELDDGLDGAPVWVGAAHE
ncbi:FAD/NAD(P)-binding protein [Nakamurella leprariae]|uniref:FAD/NAD(P)-binding protein n=1 Tax=Nakamurella leprariae TaxID=2803911 RepID=A0A939BY76_9ACTN|nr:FAD/NAD(P)-binding protein [Nakamurella leprariae]MBM9469283.1 FAD/NAD(P)-binding protein [Nakamurella leprariae]